MSEVNFLQVGSWSQCAHCFMFYCGEHYCGADWQAKPVDFGKELDAAWLANVGKRLGSGPAPVPSGPPEAPRGAEPLPEVAGLPVTGPPDWEALCEEALATSWGANEDCARRLHNALRDAIRASAPSAGAARANELADALDVLATYEVLAPYPVALRYLAEVAALLRSRAAPLDTDADWYKVLEILARPENGAAEQAAHEAGKPAVVTVPPWVCHFAARRLAALAHPEIKA